ncbi:(2Fe-2S)-binding protein [Bosea sp. (in: a-proteobacteria)]|jgi:predicted molibdopterin-dependent oxidoreductase YjgC|uniref:(2Fe-2S)-binding protein n=1 Tax=Bosea sp. (in: a-proteobacteria) TaxID=1871050 RepID=UPI001AC1AB6A|nr:(2Fe-2S)-binding protein [Bosea sp. (in: a-proteobacteria)]MBN9437371.1 (2Fe-2S)-binding protein [Bosea sp. (in: a-proteobacteria)]MBN9447808.1 (2Fe-2S)-binding protein [Bosea sp. (in: a-proteobacteria)]
MFRRIEPDAAENGLTLTFEGRAICFRPGDSLAAALLAAGIGALRQSPVDASPRAPYCMMGVCFECLVEIDGRQNQQACLTPAQDGMVVRRQIGARQLP